MRFLIPLGLLGLLGLAVLILIYLLKPNYQQKLITSTYVWKLSLKYKKKKIPISRLRNLLIILCQILIITGCAFVMAKPVLAEETVDYAGETIVIIDASANMLAADSGQTRFDRAVSEVRTHADEVLAEDGVVTVILAGTEASYVVQRLTVEDRNILDEKLTELECSYGEGDIDGAMALAEELLYYNPNAEVVLYTATHYTNTGDYVRVEDVSVEGEWNVGILSATATLEDNYYTFAIEVASYGADKAFEVYCDVYEANGTTQTVTLPVNTVYCSGEPVTVVYTSGSQTYGENTVPVYLTDNNKIFSFEQVRIHIEEADSYGYDNEFYIYGGNRPTIKVEYYSTLPNNFVTGVLMGLSQTMGERYHIETRMVNGSTGATPELEGYDVYIFEHTMPSALPTDGIILMVDPDKSVGAGFTVGKKTTIQNWTGDGATLAAGVDHPILNYIDASQIRVTEYTQINESSLDRYDVLMYYEGNPVFFARNEAQSKIAVLAFNLHMSNLPLSLYFPVLMNNLFEYFLPVTVEATDAAPGDAARNAFDVYETVNLNARAEQLSVTDPEKTTQLYSEFPAEFSFEIPGTYTVMQTLMSDEILEEQFYVRIPSSQSDIARTVDVLESPEIERTTEISYEDLLIYFAAVIVALLFAEWWLQSRNGI